MKLTPLTKILLVTCALAPAAVAAQPLRSPPSTEPSPLSKTFTIDPNDPESSIPPPEELKKHPLDYGYLLMDFDERAALAIKRGDVQKALKYHRAAAKLVPERAVSFRLICQDYEKLGSIKEAYAACGAAVRLEGATVDDFVRYVHLARTHYAALDADQREDARNAIAHLKETPETRLAGYELECELSVVAKDTAALERCSGELTQHAPKAPRSLTYAWALAMQKNQRERATALLAEARAAGVSEAALANMERAHQAAEETESVSASEASALDMRPVWSWLLGLAVLAFAGILFARRLGRHSVG